MTAQERIFRYEQELEDFKIAKQALEQLYYNDKIKGDTMTHLAQFIDTKSQEITEYLGCELMAHLQEGE